jgi:lysophospholipase L1-like esterase
VLTNAALVLPAEGGVDVHEYGIYFLRDWTAQVGKILNGTTTQAVVAWIGDSWASQANITAPLTAFLQNLFGNAGPGYISANDATVTPTGIVRTVLGTWAHGSGVTASGASMTDMTSTDVATPATIQIVATATDFVVHYLKQPNGGSFTWKIDGGAPTTIATANASILASTVTIGGLSNASHTLLLTVTVAGAAGVTIDGVDCRIAVAGVRVHNLGFTGTSTTEWAGVTAAPWQGALLALAPNVVGIMLGVNDLAANLTPAAYTANLTTIITRVRAVLPTCDILLAIPSDIGISGTYTMADYAQAMQALAWANGYGFVNSYKWLGPYATANTRGLYSNTTHVNAAGGYVLAELLALALTLDTPLHAGAYFDDTGFAKGAVTIGTLTVSVFTLSGNLHLGATAFLDWPGRFAITTLASGKLLLEDYAAANGIVLDVTTDGTARLRNRADSADAQLAVASVRGNAVTFANRPATPVEGMVCAFTDSTTVVWGATITGTGANHVLGYYNGTNWTVAGK